MGLTFGIGLSLPTAGNTQRSSPGAPTTPRIRLSTGTPATPTRRTMQSAARVVALALRLPPAIASPAWAPTRDALHKAKGAAVGLVRRPLTARSGMFLNAVQALLVKLVTRI